MHWWALLLPLASSFLMSGRAPFPLLRMGLSDPPLELCEENVDRVLDQVRQELGTIFGYDAKSRDVGITGAIDLVEIDGPTIVVRLTG